MERLIGPNLEVALSLNEGQDFGFINSDFLVVASFDHNDIETNVFSCGQLVNFNSELIWASTKSNIKRMKNYKVPIRLDFYKILDGQKQPKSFGYVIVTLKSAQYLPKGECVAIREETYKVCGLGKEAKGSNPQVVLSLRIQDVEENDDILSARSSKQEVPQEVTCKSAESSIILQTTGKTLEMNVAKEHPDTTPKHFSNKIAPRVPDTGHSGGDNNRPIQAFHSYMLEINLIDINWLTSMKDVHFRFHHARGEVTWSAHENVPETFPGAATNLKNVSARLLFLESPTEVDTLLANVPPTLTKEEKKSADVTSIITMERLATLSFSARLTDQGPQTVRQLSVVDGEDFLGERLKDELETWKEKEREKFQLEFNDRLKEEIARLQTEWGAREKELEKEASERMEICRSLSEELQKVMDDVKEKEITLEKTKTELESGYRQLVADTKKETTALREELLERLKEKDGIISSLQEEVETLRHQLATETKKVGSLTKEQTEALLFDMKKLQEKLENANNSRAFFKEQWSRAVRELHRIKSDGRRDIQVQLQCRKEELKQLGLEQILENHRGQKAIRYDSESCSDAVRRLLDEKLEGWSDADKEELFRVSHES